MGGCILFLIQGCATTLQLQPVSSNDQKTYYEEGQEVVISPEKYIVAVKPATISYTSEQRPTFVVSVFNPTSDPIVFSTENIKASLGDQVLKVFTYEELVTEVKKHRTLAAFAVALSGAVQSYNASRAGYQYQSGTVNTNYYGNYYGSSGYGNYSGYGTGTYSGYTYDPAAAAQAQAAVNDQTAQQMKAVTSAANNSLTDLENTILKKNTVFPQTWQGGYVELEKCYHGKSERTPISLDINIEGENHHFEFKQARIE